MTGHIIVGLVVIMPLFLGVAFRVHTSHLFFSIMAGELLGRYFGHDVDNQAQTVSYVAHGYGEVVLLLMPMFITAYIMKGSISTGKLLIQSVPLIITGVILAAFLFPILPETIQSVVVSSSIGAKIIELNRIIIGIMIALQLLELWFISKPKNMHHTKHQD